MFQQDQRRLKYKKYRNKTFGLMIDVNVANVTRAILIQAIAW